MPPKLPGFYYDETKKKYFKIISGASAATPSIQGTSNSTNLTKYTQSDIQRQQREKSEKEERENKLRKSQRRRQLPSQPTIEIDVNSINPEVDDLELFLRTSKCLNISQFNYLLENYSIVEQNEQNKDFKLIQVKVQLHMLKHRQIMSVHTPFDPGLVTTNNLSWVKHHNKTLYLGIKEKMILFNTSKMDLSPNYHIGERCEPSEHVISSDNFFRAPVEDIEKVDIQLQLNSNNRHEIAVFVSSALLRLITGSGDDRVALGDRFRLPFNSRCYHYRSPEYIVGFALINGSAKVVWFSERILSLTLESEPTFITSIKKYKKDIAAIGTRSGNIYITVKDEFSDFYNKRKVEFGGSVCSLNFIEIDNFVFLLASGLNNCLILYQLRSDLQLIEVIKYQGYEHRLRLQENVQMHKSDYFFAVSNDNLKELKVYYIFHPKPLELACKLQYEAIATSNPGFCFVENSLLIVQGSKLLLYS